MPDAAPNPLIRHAVAAGLALVAAFSLVASPSLAQSLAPPLFRCEFVLGNAMVTPDCRDAARRLRDHWSAAIAAGMPFARVDVLGAADPREARRDRGLPRRRAAAVAALLVTAGFAPERLSVDTAELEEPVVLMDPFGAIRCLFPPGGVAVTPACMVALRAVLGLVADHPVAQRDGLVLDINGFIDDREARTAPAGLATRRAEAVVEALRALGLRTQTLNARGLGPEAAARPSSRADARERAVSVVVVPPPGGAGR